MAQEPVKQQPQPTTPTDPNYDEYQKKADELTQASVKRLQEIHRGFPDVDYDKLFAPYFQKQEQQQTMRSPGRMESFARAFGSQEGAQSVLGQLQQAHAEQMDKAEKTLQTHHDLLMLKANQEVQKGKADEAILTNAELDRTKFGLDALKSQRDAAEALRLEQERQQGREKLLGQKLDNAKTMVRARLQAELEKLKFDPRITMKLMDLYAEPLFIALKGDISANPVLGTALTSEEQDRLVKNIQDKIPEIKKRAFEMSGAPHPDAGTKAPKVEEDDKQQPGESSAHYLYRMDKKKGTSSTPSSSTLVVKSKKR